MSGEHVTMWVLVVSAGTASEEHGSRVPAHCHPLYRLSLFPNRHLLAAFPSMLKSPLKLASYSPAPATRTELSIETRLTGHLEDGHQVWKQRWHNFIVLNAASLFCCVPDFMATPCDDQEWTALPEWAASTRVASGPHRAPGLSPSEADSAIPPHV